MKLCAVLVGRCGQDVRQVLHHLSMVKASQQEERMGAEQASSCVVHKVFPRGKSGAIVFLSFFEKEGNLSLARLTPLPFALAPTPIPMIEFFSLSP